MLFMLDFLMGTIAAASLAGIGYSAGISRAKAAKSETPKAICLCSHPISFHEEMAGACHGTVRVESKWDSDGDPKAWRQDPCPCMTYAGPELISLFSVRELAQGDHR